MALTRVTDTDDDGTGTTGTIHNNAWLQTLFDAVELNWDTSSYTPAITASGSNPTASAVSGQYWRSGEKVIFRGSITISTAGTGNYSISLPAFTAASGGIPGQVSIIAQDVSGGGGALYPGMGVVNAAGTTFGLYNNASPMATMTPSVPFSFASTDVIYFAGWYFTA